MIFMFSLIYLFVLGILISQIGDIIVQEVLLEITVMQIIWSRNLKIFIFGKNFLPLDW